MVRLIVISLLLTACGGASRTAIKGDPLAGVSAASLHERGRNHEHSGDHVRAEQYYAAALTRGHEAAMIPLLRVCVTSDRYGAALRYAQAQLTVRPESWQLRYLMAELLGAVGRTNEERAELETLVSEVADRPDPHFALAEVYRHEGRSRRAEFHYRRYLALAPTGAHARAARSQQIDLREQRREERQRKKVHRLRRRR